MEFMFRYATSVYGEEQLIGASWDLIWWFAGAAAIYIAVDLVFRLLFVRKSKPAAPDDGARVLRHKLIDRVYHWTMAACVLTVAFTAFAPILDWKFEWVTAHWIAGALLSLLVMIHIVRAVVFQDRWAMMITPADVAASLDGVRKTFGKLSGAARKPGKYTLMQKAYHLGVGGLLLAMIVTGLTMFAKIDTTFWQRNPYILATETWGYVYAAHGLCAMAVLAIVAIHIYLGVRPDKWFVNRSMFTGRMAKRDYLAHHDPARWSPDQSA
jgi:formate dehydrogenase subunit gamma